MNNFLCCIFFIASLLGIWGCGTQSQKAVDYNDRIVKAQISVLQREEALVKAINDNQRDQYDSLFSAFRNVVDSASTVVSSMEPFEGNSEFRDAAVGLLSAYNTAINQYFKEIITLASCPDSMFLNDKSKEIAGIARQADQIIDPKNMQFLEAQRTFAKENGLTFSE